MSQLGTKKSRRGCKKCKQRRVKCDERTPCGNCIRREEECSLLETSPFISSNVANDPAIPSDDEEWISDLELMYHYSSSTSSNLMSIRPEAHFLWSSYIPQQAMKHPSLMHGLLALAAVHLAYLRPESSAGYLQLCDKHQAVALQKFRTILSSDIDPQLAGSLFALSSVTSICSMARYSVASESNALNMDAMCEIMWLTKGVRDVTVALYEHIKAGPMLGVFEDQKVPDGVQITLPASLSNRLSALQEMVAGLDGVARADCENAVSELERVYRAIQYFAATSHIEAGPIYTWMVHVPDGYVRLVQACNPVALIILAFYTTTFTAIRRSWFTQNFATFTLEGISLKLDESLQHWLAWPRQQLIERLDILGVKAAEEEAHEPRPLIGF